jgi:hypothetical protein
MLIVLVIVAAIVAVFFIRRRLAEEKLTPPDFVAVAYGNNTRLAYVVPDDKAAKLAQLSVLIKADNFSLALALAAVSSASEDDLLSKALVYIAQKHDYADKLILAFIEHEVSASSS